MIDTAHRPADVRSPVIETTIGGLLRDAVAADPGAVALVDGCGAADRRRWTYAELLAVAERVAAGLLARFRPGERVAVWAPNSPEWLFVHYGAALAGLALVTVNPGLRGKELAHVLRQSEASGICLIDDYRGNPMARSLADIRDGLPCLRETLRLYDWEAWATPLTSRPDLPEVAPDDVAMIIFTSGTTGAPKGAMLRHRGLANNYRFNADRLGMGADDVFVSAVPLFHVGGAAMAALTALASRATFVLAERVSAPLMLELIETERATAMIGVPTMFIDMLGELDLAPRDIAAMRLIMIGGSMVSPDLIRTLETRFGASVRNSFGQTESGSIICATEANDPPEIVAETVGRPFPQVETRIVTTDGATAALGESGELLIRGYQVMAGYVGLADATAAAIDPEGWLHTGDVCTIDADGRVRVVARLNDMIIRGGENLFPAEIEEAIRNHPAVGDVAVIGVPDARLGEAVAAYVRPASGASLDPNELVHWLADLLSREKIPTIWHLVDDLPLTATGKINKQALRDRAHIALLA